MGQGGNNYIYIISLTLPPKSQGIEISCAGAWFEVNDCLQRALRSLVAVTPKLMLEVLVTLGLNGSKFTTE